MNRTTIALAFAIVGLAGTGFYLANTAQTEKEPAFDLEAKPASSTQTPLPQQRLASQNFEIKSQSEPRPKKPQRVNDSKILEDEWSRGQVEEDYVKAFQRYPHLRENAKYAGKALLTDAEMANWRKSLEDESLIFETIQGLSEHYNPNYDLDGSIVNQERIKFLKYSAQLANNPASDSLFAGIEAFIADSELDTSDFNDALKRDVAGDKIELIYIYEAFKKGGKQRLDELAAKSPKFAKLLKYARENSHHLNRII